MKNIRQMKPALKQLNARVPESFHVTVEAVATLPGACQPRGCRSVFFASANHLKPTTCKQSVVHVEKQVDNQTVEEHSLPMKTNEAKSNYDKAISNAKNDSLCGLPTAVYQTGADRFVVTSTPISAGMIVGVFCNGASDGRYLRLFHPVAR